jgi:glycerol-3-phosphate dehydrogenase
MFIRPAREVKMQAAVAELTEQLERPRTTISAAGVRPLARDSRRERMRSISRSWYISLYSAGSRGVPRAVDLLASRIIW